MDVGLLFRAPQLAQGIVQMLGIVESLSVKMDRLLSSDFNSGIKCLENLKIARRSQDFLLHEAWKRFSIALTHEKGERKAFAYLALAFCQYRLGEKECCIKTLSEFMSCDFTDKRKEFMTGLADGALSIYNLFSPRSSSKESTNQNPPRELIEMTPDERIAVLKIQAAKFINEETV